MYTNLYRFYGHGVSILRPLNCLFNNLFQLKKNQGFASLVLCGGNQMITDGFRKAENVSISWYHSWFHKICSRFRCALCYNYIISFVVSEGFTNISQARSCYTIAPVGLTSSWRILVTWTVIKPQLNAIKCKPLIYFLGCAVWYI